MDECVKLGGAPRTCCNSLSSDVGDKPLELAELQLVVAAVQPHHRLPHGIIRCSCHANRLGAAGGIRLSRSLSNTKSHSVFAIPPCRIYRRPAERSFRLVPVSYCVLRSPRTARNWSLAHTPTTLLSISFLFCLFLFLFSSFHPLYLFLLVSSLCLCVHLQHPPHEQALSKN